MRAGTTNVARLTLGLVSWPASARIDFHIGASAQSSVGGLLGDGVDGLLEDLALSAGHGAGRLGLLADPSRPC